MKRRNKKIIAAALTAALASSALAFTAFADDTIKIVVNGSELNIPEGDTRPFIENDRTLVPMRAIFEALGADVQWDGEARRVTAHEPVSDVTVVLDIDSKTMLVNGEAVELDVPAKIANDRTVVPVRAIAEGMKCVVDWDGDTRTVTVEKGRTPVFSFKTLDEVNAYIQANSKSPYTVPNIAHPAMEVEGYVYDPSDNSTEIFGIWGIGAGGNFSVTMIPGSAKAGFADASAKAEKTIELFSGAKADMYVLTDNDKYAVWENNGYTFCSSVKANDWEPSEVVKYLANRIDIKLAPESSDSIFGAWSYDGAEMTIDLGLGGSDAEIFVRKTVGGNEMEWHMSGAFDAAKKVITYSDGYKIVSGKDAQGNNTYDTVWESTTGTLELRDGAVYWTDSKEEIASGSKFIKPQEIFDTPTVSDYLGFWNDTVNEGVTYVCDKTDDPNVVSVTVTRMNSDTSATVWRMDNCKYDAATGTLSYTNGRKVELTFNEYAVEKEEIVWENGEGTFQHARGVLIYWSDTQDDALAASCRFMQEDIVDAQEYFGSYQDSVSQRATMTIEEGPGDRDAVVVIRWSGSASEWAEWRMGCDYDADKNILTYDNGSKSEIKAVDENGGIEEKEIWTGSTGSFELRDGIVYWTDSKETEAAGRKFEKADINE